MRGKYECNLPLLFGQGFLALVIDSVSIVNFIPPVLSARHRVALVMGV
jgi:hypothetical protein